MKKIAIGGGVLVGVLLLAGYASAMGMMGGYGMGGMMGGNAQGYQGEAPYAQSYSQPQDRGLLDPFFGRSSRGYGYGGYGSGYGTGMMGPGMMGGCPMAQGYDGYGGYGSPEAAVTHEQAEQAIEG